MIEAHNIQFYIPKHDGSADGQALTDFAVEGGSDLTTLVNSALTQADNFFADSIAQMSNEELAHVEASSQSGTSLSLYRDLSASPAGTFNIFPVSGAAESSYRSSNRIPSLVSTTFMTGIDAYYLPGINGTGQAELQWIPGLSEISFKAPGDTEFGAAVTIAGDGTYYAYAAPAGDFGVDRYIEIEITEASLPVGDTTDTLTVTRLQSATIPNTEGDQTAATPCPANLDAERAGVARGAVRVTQRVRGHRGCEAVTQPPLLTDQLPGRIQVSVRQRIL